MIEIIFQNIGDAKRFHHFLQMSLLSSDLRNHDILLFEDQHKVSVKMERVNQEHMSLVKKSFYHFIIEIKQNDWFRMILEDHYYYKDPEEQEQILDIIQSILEGNRIELVNVIDDLEQDQRLEEVIDRMFSENVSFSFDSFVRFRMRPFMEQLEKYVEVSIDEYKMEQDYQMFIQTLRDFLAGRKTKFSHLHLLMDDEVCFYDDQLYEIKRADLIKMIDRKLLSNHPVYVDSVTIAPLLSIAPSVIYLYTDDLEQPLVRTIRNIFEERVVVKSMNSFYENVHLNTYTADEKM